MNNGEKLNIILKTLILVMIILLFPLIVSYFKVDKKAIKSIQEDSDFKSQIQKEINENYKIIDKK